MKTALAALSLMLAAATGCTETVEGPGAGGISDADATSLPGGWVIPDARADAAADVASPCGDQCAAACGPCPVGFACNAADQCAPVGCIPGCVGKVCGDDGCGGLCGSCSLGQLCLGGVCSGCQPSCAGSQCGDDGCGGSCGACDPGSQCSADGACVCVPDCGDKECGDDGCGGLCSVCPDGFGCGGGTCVAKCTDECASVGERACAEGGFKACAQLDGDPCLEWDAPSLCGPSETCKAGDCVCLPSCAGAECGDDGCGGGCGTCAPGTTCSGGACSATCSDECAAGAVTCFGNGVRACGQFDADACLDWGPTTPCGAGSACQDGACACQPSCAGKTCGGDGCGGTCGACGDGKSCVGGACACQPSCVGKSCGDDGCGGTCGVCGTSSTCAAGQCVCTPVCGTPCPGGDPQAGCGIWTLPADGFKWTAHPLDPLGSIYAPKSPIQAAFSEDWAQIVWVLTATTWHALDPATLQWIDSGPRDALFPEVAGKTILAAISVPAWWNKKWGGTGESADVVLMMPDAAWFYHLTLASLSFELGDKLPYGPEWSASKPHGLDPSAVTSSWLAVQNDSGWVAGGVDASVCGQDIPKIGPYQVALTAAGMLHVVESGTCFVFVQSMPGTDFSVFKYPGAPKPATIQDIAWTGSMLIAF